MTMRIVQKTLIPSAITMLFLAAWSSGAAAHPINIEPLDNPVPITSVEPFDNPVPW